MAHFAEISSSNEVLRLIVVNNQQILDPSGQESEQLGITFCQNLFGGNWLQTSYTSKIRKNYAAQGYFYDIQRDAFIAPKPFPSWILNEDTCQWVSPVAYPQDEHQYYWDEESQNWLKI